MDRGAEAGTARAFSAEGWIKTPLAVQEDVEKQNCVTLSHVAAQSAALS